MARKTILTVIALIVVLGLIFWYQQSKDNDDTNLNTALSISAFNQTKNVDATSTAAAPKDVIVYTLTVMNNSDEVVSGYVVETNIEDVAQLATLIDAQGANFNAQTNSLMWTPLDIPANGSIEKKFTVRVKDVLPNDSDLVMNTAFGGNVSVAVSRSAVAGSNTPGAQTPPYIAPPSGPSAWFAFMLAVAFTAGVILYRTARRMSI